MHRRRDPDKHQNSHKLKRNQNFLKCGQCHQVGHNKRSCKKKQTVPAGARQTKARAKGRKNVALSNKGNGQKRVSCYYTCFFGNLLKLTSSFFFFFFFFFVMQVGSTDVNFMGFRIPAGVGQDETRVKGKKNMASSD